MLVFEQPKSFSHDTEAISSKSMKPLVNDDSDYCACQNAKKQQEIDLLSQKRIESCKHLYFCFYVVINST